MSDNGEMDTDGEEVNFIGKVDIITKGLGKKDR